MMDDMTINDVVSDECNCEGDPVVNGCTDDTATNYDPSANVDDGSCAIDDACGVCGGPGEIYDCGWKTFQRWLRLHGNQLDALGGAVAIAGAVRHGWHLTMWTTA